MRNNAVCCHDQLCGTPHLEKFLHTSLALGCVPSLFKFGKLRSVIFLSVKVNISTIEIFFQLCVGFPRHLPPKFIFFFFFDEDTVLNVARGNLALDNESEKWEKIQAGELRLHALVREAQQKERKSRKSSR